MEQHDDTRIAAMRRHPSNGGAGTGIGTASPQPVASHDADSERGSLVTEYGLLAVIAATIAGVVMQWASQGALVGLFNALLEEARALVGA